MKNMKLQIKKRKMIFYANKITKTNIIEQSENIKCYIPCTVKMTGISLQSMLNQYHMVYVKPRNGSLGRGVIQITKQEEQYLVHAGVKISHYASFDAMYDSLLKKIKKESYIVQQGIHSLRIDNKLLDFRVVVQRSPHGGFEVTGIAGTMSKAKRVVSNASGGGDVGSVESLLSPEQCELAVPHMKEVALLIMNQVSKRLPKQNEIGIDFALDSDLKPWILEYNTRPDHRLFLLIKDPEVVKKIVSYGAKYGKKYKLKNYSKARN